MNKILRLGKTAEGNVFCKISITEGKLSISGVIGPMRNGNCKGSCGQIIMSGFDDMKYAPGWSRELVEQFSTVWKKYHLNDMNAGTPKQTEYLEQYERLNPAWRYDYLAACVLLEAAGLLIDEGYKYGTKWRMVELPKEVVEFLNGLPDSDKTPAWV